MKQANAYIRDIYLPAVNNEFAVAQRSQQACLCLGRTPIQDILCEQYERKVGNDNCIKFDGLTFKSLLINTDFTTLK